MFFWKKILIETIVHYQKTSLQASRNYKYPNIKGLPLNHHQNKSERTFSFSPSEFKGSICIEASLSFSFFLFFITNILAIILSFSYYFQDITVLQQRGKETAAVAYATSYLWPGNEDLITLEKDRTVKSPFIMFAIPDYKLKAKCVVKPWVGYDVAGRTGREKEEFLVYITEYGSVYHLKRSCAYLSLSIRISSIEKVQEEKNEQGKKYQACEYCGKNSFVSAVYITSYGNKYHTSLNCRGLKRTVKSVPLSEVTEKGVCKKCG